MKRVAWVIGGSGMVGSALIRQLSASSDFDEIHVFVRRPQTSSLPNVQTHVIDFENPGDALGQLRGDVLFSALGTTLKTAGSKERQFHIDHDYVLDFATVAAQRGVQTIVNVSSIGAREASRNFYLRMKGQLETALDALPVPSVIHLRPSMLDGDRTEFRLGEKLSLPIMRLLTRLPGFQRWGVIHAEQVARAALRAANTTGPGRHTWEMPQLLASKTE